MLNILSEGRNAYLVGRSLKQKHQRKTFHARIVDTGAKTTMAQIKSLKRQEFKGFSREAELISKGGNEVEDEDKTRLIERLEKFAEENKLVLTDDAARLMELIVRCGGHCQCNRDVNPIYKCPRSVALSNFIQHGTCFYELFSAIQYKEVVFACIRLMMVLITSFQSNQQGFRFLYRCSAEEICDILSVLEQSREETSRAKTLFLTNERIDVKGTGMILKLIEIGIEGWCVGRNVESLGSLKMKLIAEDKTMISLVVKGKITIIDFFDKRCITCNMLSSVLDGLDKDQISIITVDINEEKDMADRLFINVFPYLAVFDRDRRPVIGIEGFPKEEEILELFDKI